MEILYTEGKSPTSSANGLSYLFYSKVIMDNDKYIEGYYWDKQEYKWVKKVETEGQKERGARHIQYLKGTEIFMEMSWTHRIMSSLEALVMFGKEE